MAEAILREKAIKILIENIGIVDTERFVSIISREPKDYTKNREKPFCGMSLDEIYNEAKEF